MTPSRPRRTTAARRAAWRRLAAYVAALVGAAVLVPAVGTVAASAAPKTTPGDFTGYAFDARCAPTQEEMDAWLTGSPFWGVGIYIGGSMMSCKPSSIEPGQPHLDAGWVERQSRKGWRLLPVWVGPQASCSSYAVRIDSDPSSSYAAARQQGRAQATQAVERARELGIVKRSTLWYDLEGGFDLSDDDCRRSALSFLSGWTKRVQQLGFTSGVYSSASAGIHALDYADSVSPGSYAMPEQVWFAWYNGKADTGIDPRWVRSESWTRDRVHQYAEHETATYGGVALTIDRNFMAVGRGSRPGKAPRTCGVAVDFDRYRVAERGDRGRHVEALQCLLKQRDSYRGKVDGRFDGPVRQAVRAFQRSHDVRVTGRADRRTWVALLSDGGTPVLKYGSAGEPVRRVQRALNAAVGAELKVTGVFAEATVKWVDDYRERTGLDATGVVDDDMWELLQTGRR